MPPTCVVLQGYVCLSHLQQTRVSKVKAEKTNKEGNSETERGRKRDGGGGGMGWERGMGE